MAASYQHIQVEGLRELDRRLTELGPKLAKKVGWRATGKGAAVVRDAARNLARFERGYSTGFTKSNIILFKPSKRRRELATEMHVGVRLKGTRKQRLSKRTIKRQRQGRQILAYPGYYWFMLEYGTKHMAKQPFLGPAFNATQHQALDKMIAEVRAGIEKWTPNA
jgi:HK97 gp10 family phage protein